MVIVGILLHLLLTTQIISLVSLVWREYCTKHVIAAIRQTHSCDNNVELAVSVCVDMWMLWSYVRCLFVTLRADNHLEVGHSSYKSLKLCFFRRYIQRKSNEDRHCDCCQAYNSSIYRHCWYFWRSVKRFRCLTVKILFHRVAQIFPGHKVW